MINLLKRIGGALKDAVVQMFGLQAVFGPGTGEVKRIVQISCNYFLSCCKPWIPPEILLLIRMHYVNCHPPLASIPLSGLRQRAFCCNPALLAMGF